MKNEIGMSVFEICRKNIKMPLEELFQWLGISEEERYSLDFGGCFIRFLDNGLAQFSCSKSDFDRWANSQEYEFDLYRPSERRAFLNIFETKMHDV